jgi:PPE-repeat protein
MRGIAPIFVVLAVGVAGAMLGASGFADAWGAPAPQTSAAQDEVENASSQVDPQEGPVAGPVNSRDSSTIGLLVNAASTFVDVLGAVVLLPLTLSDLGFPAWFAYPVGLIAQTVAGISFLEAVTRTEWT